MGFEAFEGLLAKFVDYSRGNLDFSIGDMSYYSCLPLCALDAVFSIKVRSTGASRTVDRFCAHYKIPHSANNPYKVPSKAKQTTVGQALGLLKDTTPEQLAGIISDRHRTSPKNGILKATAFMQWLDILELYGIQTYQDFHKHWEDANLERDLRAVRGQRIGISADYFYMLAGNTSDVKVDRYITAYACEATGESRLSATTIKKLFKEAVKELASDHPGLTVRHLDYLVREFQKTLIV